MAIIMWCPREIYSLHKLKIRIKAKILFSPLTLSIRSSQSAGSTKLQNKGSVKILKGPKASKSLEIKCGIRVGYSSRPHSSKTIGPRHPKAKDPG